MSEPTPGARQDGPQPQPGVPAQRSRWWIVASLLFAVVAVGIGGYLRAIGSAFGADSITAGIDQAKCEIDALTRSCSDMLDS